MALEIRECIGQEGLEVKYANGSKGIAIKEGLTKDLDPIDPSSIMVDIEGIHVGPTRNFTWYMKEALKGSVPTWTHPYERPLIMFHNEKDGKIIGRIKNAEYTEMNTKSGTGALLFTANVPDKEGKAQIQDGRLKTVSIGAIVHDARCSICGANLAEMSEEELEEHEHKRGGIYIVDGIEKVCYWQIYKMEAKELSYVIVPSDIYAQNIKIYKPNKAQLKRNEYVEKEVFSVSEAVKSGEEVKDQKGTGVKEEVTIDENGEKEKPEAPEVKGEVVDYKAKYEAEKAEKEKLEDDIKILKADKEKTDEQVKTVSKELDDTKVLLQTATQNLSKAKDDLKIKDGEYLKEKGLRENLENERIKLLTNVKESTVDRVIMLRESLGKSAMKREDLLAREDSSLNDQLLDLQEEFKMGSGVKSITKPSNPSVVETTESAASNVKEEKQSSNISTEEAFTSIMSNLMKPNFYK